MMYDKTSVRYALSALLALGAALAGAAPAIPTANAKNNPAFAPAEHYRVTVLGDLHFDDAAFHTRPAATPNRARERERNFAMWKSDSHKLLATAARQTAGSSAFVIQLGDIAQGDCESQTMQETMLRKAFAAVKSYFPDLPLLVVTGNHDVRRLGREVDPIPAHKALAPLVAREIGVSRLANGCYAVRKGKDLFLAIDSWIGKEPLHDFIQKALADNRDCRYVIFLTHLPVFPASLRPYWLTPGYDEIADLLETRRATVLAAHTHAFSVVLRQNSRGTLKQLITTSMGDAWTPGRMLTVRAPWGEFMADAVKQWSIDIQGEMIRKLTADLLKTGKFTGSIYQAKSGFTVLDIDDERIEAGIYTDDSGKPALTEVLVRNR